MAWAYIHDEKSYLAWSILLGVFVIGLLIYRNRRKQRRKGKGIADTAKASRAYKEGE